MLYEVITDVTGNPGYWSLLLVNKDSPINSLADVLKCDKSLTFGNGDPNSTSGFLVPSFYVFAKNNVDPKECFKVVRNASVITSYSIHYTKLYEHGIGGPGDRIAAQIN